MSRVVGFDFGTTNSLISVVVGDRVVSLLDQSGLPHPSVVCYQGTDVIVGRKAKERLAVSGTGVIGNVIKSPKTLLGQHNVFVEGASRSPKEMVSHIVKQLIADASDREPGDYSRAVVTIPVDMNGARRADLREAFCMAGVNILQFIHEPLAALYGHFRGSATFDDLVREFDRELILVFDWGGGTLDLTLCQILDGTVVQLLNDGCSAVGGDVVDEIVRNEIIRRCLSGRKLSVELTQQPDAARRLLDRAERAKIELSTKEKYNLYVPDFFKTDDHDRDIDYELSRTELEEIVGAKIEEGVRRIHLLLDKARVDPASIALCLATGGMVNMPAIKSRLREIFGPQRLNVSERGNTIISEGAAWIAHDRATLSLAKNIEIVLARDSYFPIIKAGTTMPREKEILKTEGLSVYCTDPRDGVAKFQFVSPKKPGRRVQATDERNTLECLSLKVDAKAKHFEERLVMDVSIDDNLVLRAHARSLGQNDDDEVEVHSLEFGLDLFKKGENATESESSLTLTNQGPRAPGSVSLRSNISIEKDEKLVPGEFLYALDPAYFNYVARGTPQYQDDERLYYKPCASCRRPKNHPMCRCATGGTPVGSP